MNTFLKLLYGTVIEMHNQGKIKENQFLELRGISNKGKVVRDFFPISQFESGFEAFVNRYNDSYNIYYGVATRKNEKGGSKKDCGYLPAIYIDIDCDSESRKSKTYFKTKREVIDLIALLDFGESLIVDSGNGIHLYWLFKEPIQLNSGYDEMLEELMKNLSLIFGGDATHDVSRILRVPGSMNIKSPNNPTVCEVIKHNSEKRYSLEELTEKITSSKSYFFDFDTIKSKDIRDLIFGVFDRSKFKSNSEADQKLITLLLSHSFSSEDIEYLFNIYPTSGKYNEKKSKEGEEAAIKYLRHSIKNAKKYIAENVVRKQHHKTPAYIENNNTCSINSYNNGITLIDQERYMAVYKGKDTGYYRYKTDSNGEAVAFRMTNFIIEFNEQIRSNIDGSISSVLKGKIKFNDGKVESFNNLDADALASSADLRKFLSSAFATKVKFISYANELPEAIKALGEEPKLTEAMHNGFNETYDKYITKDLIITPDEFIDENTPILFDNIGHKNYLGFNRPRKNKALSQVKSEIKNNFLNWDTYDVTLYSLTAAMLSIIYPFIRKYCNGKPYLVLQGPSGCGKSTMILINQGFYGHFNDLTSFSSTPYSIETKGHAFKDALYCVDDMKLANIPERDRNKIQLLFQNYADETGRSRLNVDLTLREQRFIQGVLMVSAEDLVLTETSTIARGIIVPVSQKSPNYALRNQLVEESQSYQIFTKHFIQSMLRIADRFDFKRLFEEKQRELEELRGELELEGDNVPRMINNFAVFSTTFHFVKYFLFGDDGKEYIRKIDERFLEATKSLMELNFRKIQSHKPEEKFENTLWELVEMDRLKLLPIGEALDYNTKRENVIGYYQIQEHGETKVAINIVQAYRKVNEFLLNEGGLGHSRDAIVQKLIMQDKIRIPSKRGLSDSRVSFGNQGMQRGVEWLGTIPFESLGIPNPIIAATPIAEVVEDDSKLPF